MSTIRLLPYRRWLLVAVGTSVLVAGLGLALRSDLLQATPDEPYRPFTMEYVETSDEGITTIRLRWRSASDWDTEILASSNPQWVGRRVAFDGVDHVIADPQDGVEIRRDPSQRRVVPAGWLVPRDYSKDRRWVRQQETSSAITYALVQDTQGRLSRVENTVDKATGMVIHVVQPLDGQPAGETRVQSVRFDNVEPRPVIDTTKAVIIDSAASPVATATAGK